MSRIIFEKICIWIIAACCSAIFFLPLVILTQTYYPYVFGKIALFRIFVEIGIMVWIPLMVLEKKYRPPLRHPFVLALSVFMGALILTMFTGIDPYRSFWSSQERMTGVFTMLHFYVWFLMMISVFQTYKIWRRFSFLTIAISVIVCIYGFVLQSGDRFSSTLGNPIYLGVYAMMHIFLMLFLICRERKFRKIFSFFFFLIIAFEFFIMILSGTRAAFAATLMGMSILLIPFVSFLISKKKLAIVWTGAVILIAAFSFVLFVNISSVGNAWFKKTITYSVNRLFLLESYTQLSARSMVWNIGLKGFQERPVFGWGWENYQNIFQKYYEKPVEGEKYFDRSHNQIVDILALTGIVGFISYLAIWITLFVLLGKKLWQRSSMFSKFASASLIALFLAYFIQNLTVFDTPAPLIMLYFFFGIAYVFMQDQKKKDENVQKKSKPSVWVYGAGAMSVVSMSVMMYWGTLVPFAKSVQALKGIQAMTSSGMTPEAIGYFKDSLSTFSFTNPEIRMELIRDIQQSKGTYSEEFKKETIFFAINEIEKSIHEHPYEARYYFFALEAYRLAAGYDPSFIQKAEQTAQTSIRLAPLRPEAYRDMAQIYMQEGDTQKAIAFTQRGIDVGVSPKDMHLFLSILLLQAKDFDKAFSELDSAEKNGLLPAEHANFPIYLAVNLPSGQENKKAVEYVDGLVKGVQKDPVALGAQTIVYYKTNRKDDAGKMLAHIQSINPGLAQEIQQYMK